MSQQNSNPPQYVPSLPVHNVQPASAPVAYQVPVMYSQQQTPMGSPQMFPQQYGQQMIFVPQQTTMEKAPLISNNPNEQCLEMEPIKQRLLRRNFQFEIAKWFDEAWHLFTHHWIACILFSILYLGTSFIPYVGPFIAIGFVPGLFIAGLHSIRPNGPGWHWSSLFNGFLFYFPTLLITILYTLAVSVGFLLFILPGFYFLIVLSFSNYVFFEYRCEGLGIIDSMTVSRKVLNKHFCSAWLFLIAIFVVNLLGMICVIGIFVTIPVTNFAIVFAFRDIFGFSAKQSQFDRNCVCF